MKHKTFKLLPDGKDVMSLIFTSNEQAEDFASNLKVAIRRYKNGFSYSNLGQFVPVNLEPNALSQWRWR